jgi:hypothetical protein
MNGASSNVSIAGFAAAFFAKPCLSFEPSAKFRHQAVDPQWIDSRRPPIWPDQAK